MSAATLNVPCRKNAERHMQPFESRLLPRLGQIWALARVCVECLNPEVGSSPGPRRTGSKIPRLTAPLYGAHDGEGVTPARMAYRAARAALEVARATRPRTGRHRVKHGILRLSRATGAGTDKKLEHESLACLDIAPLSAWRREPFITNRTSLPARGLPYQTKFGSECVPPTAIGMIRRSGRRIRRLHQSGVGGRV